ncbi:MAG TPA: hypothetical protein GX509_09585 [Firmicutes bacterium]|nr:hypothetical protein [Bacillota bacterium]HHY98975.1 hypothetical protein [Bacillota bacterium]
MLLTYPGPAGYDRDSLPPIAAVKTASIDISPHDRLLIIAPHCDDETLAAGGAHHDAVRLGAKAYVAVVTNGDGFPLAADRTFRTIEVSFWALKAGFGGT